MAPSRCARGGGPAPLVGQNGRVKADGVDVLELVAVAEQVAREAGELVHGGRPRTVTVAATKSSPQDVVTAMDTASEDLIRRRLAQLRPDDGVLGEEGGHVPGTSGVTWVVDPIDGTVNYLYGVPGFAVSIAAVTGPAGEVPTPRGWTALAGCVHGPALDETYTAARGAGAWANGERLALGDGAADLSVSLVGTGFGYLAERRRAQGRVLAHLLPQVRDIRRVGSAALDLCWVAAGRFDVYYERGLNPWDMAAGGLVVTEAGGVLRGLRGEPADAVMTVAGPARLVDSLAEILAALDADGDD